MRLATQPAIHTIANTRMRSCATTRAYVARRTAEGNITSESRRCLKRYIARELYRSPTPDKLAACLDDVATRVGRQITAPV